MSTFDYQHGKLELHIWLADGGLPFGKTMLHVHKAIMMPEAQPGNNFVQQAASPQASASNKQTMLPDVAMSAAAELQDDVAIIRCASCDYMSQYDHLTCRASLQKLPV